jgi:calcineurin-like phosphoesterase family protein
MLNDVVEQCFRHLIHYPQHSDELNKIIKDASDEINYQVLKIDAHSHAEGSTELNKYYQEINSDIQKKSLQLLGRLQNVQRNQRANVSGE